MNTNFTVYWLEICNLLLSFWIITDKMSLWNVKTTLTGQLLISTEYILPVWLVSCYYVLVTGAGELVLYWLPAHHRDGAEMSGVFLSQMIRNGSKSLWNVSFLSVDSGCPKKGGLRISALYVFYCAMWAFRGLLNILGGSYIKMKYCQALLKAFHIFLPNFDPSKCFFKQYESIYSKSLIPLFFGTPCR